MKIYCSLPMTNATDEDRRLITETRRRLRAEFPRLEVWYPDLADDSGLDMEAIQERDFAEFSQCDGCLAIWGETSARSSGMAAEVEWCRRVFQIPVVIYAPNGDTIPEWVAASAGRQISPDLRLAVKLLEAGYVNAGRALSILGLHNSAAQEFRGEEELSGDVSRLDGPVGLEGCRRRKGDGC